VRRARHIHGSIKEEDNTSDEEEAACQLDQCSFSTEDICNRLVDIPPVQKATPISVPFEVSEAFLFQG
jgi:hypothetical protein